MCYSKLFPQDFPSPLSFWSSLWWGYSAVIIYFQKVPAELCKVMCKPGSCISFFILSHLVIDSHEATGMDWGRVSSVAGGGAMESGPPANDTNLCFQSLLRLHPTYTPSTRWWNTSGHHRLYGLADWITLFVMGSLCLYLHLARHSVSPRNHQQARRFFSKGKFPAKEINLSEQGRHLNKSTRPSPTLMSLPFSTAFS